MVSGLLLALIEMLLIALLAETHRFGMREIRGRRIRECHFNRTLTSWQMCETTGYVCAPVCERSTSLLGTVGLPLSHSYRRSTIENVTGMSLCTKS